MTSTDCGMTITRAKINSHKKRTAESCNRQMLNALEYFPIYREVDGEIVLEGYRRRTVPSLELAREVITTREKINRHYSGVEVLNDEEIDALCHADHDYALMGLDLRSLTFEQDGMTGLRSVTGEVLVPPMQGVSFPERYSPFSHMAFAPIERNGKMAIVALDGSGRLLCDFTYDRIFCLPNTPYFVCEYKGKKTLFDPHKTFKSIV